jgi:hypothetical protein
MGRFIAPKGLPAMNRGMEILSLAPDLPDPGPVALLQSGGAARALGRPRLMVTDAGAPLGQALILRRLGFGAALRGPVWRPETSTGARIAALRAFRRVGLCAVEAEDTAEAGLLHAAGFRRVATPAHVAELALSPDHDALRRALSPKWRNQLRAGERAGLASACRPLAAATDPLLVAEAAQARARRYRTLPQAFACAFPGAEIHEAWLHGTPVAAMLFLRHGTVATYHIGHTTPAGRATNAHRLLLWQAMLHFAALGVTRLDLGTIDTETAPGLAAFKLGTGATARPLGGSFLAIPWL